MVRGGTSTLKAIAILAVAAWPGTTTAQTHVYTQAAEFAAAQPTAGHFNAQYTAPASGVSDTDYLSPGFNPVAACDNAGYVPGSYQSSVCLGDVYDAIGTPWTTLTLGSSLNAVGLNISLASAGAGTHAWGIQYNVNGLTGVTLVDPGQSAFIGFSDGQPLSISLRTISGASLAFAPVSAAVPEPATWGLMLFGMALVGGALRRRAVARYAL